MNRWHETADLFNNPINQSAIAAIKSYAQTGPLELLLVNNIVASGTTIKEAINYLTKHLHGGNFKFFPLHRK